MPVFFTRSCASASRTVYLSRANCSMSRVRFENFLTSSPDTLANSNPGLHTVLDVQHCFFKRFMDELLDSPIPGFDKVQRHGLWHGETEIITCSTIGNLSVFLFPGVCLLVEDRLLLLASNLRSYSQRFVRSWA